MSHLTIYIKWHLSRSRRLLLRHPLSNVGLEHRHRTVHIRQLFRKFFVFAIERIYSRKNIGEKNRKIEAEGGMEGGRTLKIMMTIIIIIIIIIVMMMMIIIIMKWRKSTNDNNKNTITIKNDE